MPQTDNIALIGAEGQSPSKTAGSLGMTEVEARQFAEIKGKMQLAKFFPRDTEQALARVKAACQNKKLAEMAVYSFPRGDSEVKGASIRLVEVLASNWGNLQFGVTELERRAGESTVKAYAWDLETNTSDEKVFTVKHIRQTKTATYALKDERDIYEAVANQAARRKRACILSLIPQDIVESAMQICDAALRADIEQKPIEEVRANIATAFAELDERITEDVIAKKAGKDFDKIQARDVVRLRNLYASIKDGFVKAAVAFDLEKEAAEADADSTEKLAAVLEDKPKEKAPAKAKKAAEKEAEAVEKTEDVKTDAEVLAEVAPPFEGFKGADANDF